MLYSLVLYSLILYSPVLYRAVGLDNRCGGVDKARNASCEGK